MAGVAVIGSGNYDLEIDTGYIWDSFTLDDTVKGVLDSTQFVLDGASQYAPVLDGTISLTAKRGRANTGAYGAVRARDHRLRQGDRGRVCPALRTSRGPLGAGGRRR